MTSAGELDVWCPDLTMPRWVAWEDMDTEALPTVHEVSRCIIGGEDFEGLGFVTRILVLVGMYW